MKLSNVAHITETSRYQKKEEAFGLPFSCLKTEEKKIAFYQRIWAQIDEDGVVQNRMVCDNYEDANYVTRCTYGEKALAVEINLWDVSEGCKYIDGTFYHEETMRRTLEAVQARGIRWQFRTTASGRTDSGSISIRNGGTRTLGVSIPTRYGHSQVSHVYWPDVEQVKAMAELFIEQTGVWEV